MASATNKFSLPLSAKSGSEIPSVGYGCWQMPGGIAADMVETAIKHGCRHIDSATCYGNEEEVGEGIRRAISAGICRREDLFVTSKLWNTYHAAEHVKAACQRSLDDLGLSYLDLYLIHFPVPLKFVPFEKRYPPGWFYDPDVANPKMEMSKVPVSETWAAMETLVDAGMTVNIGVSNFNVQAIRDLHNYARIPPSVLQVELHPYLQQKKLVRYCHSIGMHVTAYSPMGHGASYENAAVAAINEKTVKEIAAKHGVTEGQVVLRWGVQRGTSVIPHSKNPERIKKNLDLFSFALDDSDMEKMAALDKHMRFNDAGVFCESAFNTFFPIYE